MNARPVCVGITKLALMWLTTLGVGCRMSHDLVLRPTKDRYDKVQYVTEPDDSHKAEKSLQPVPQNSRVATTDSTSRPSDPTPSPPKFWAESNFDAPQLATAPAMPAPSSEMPTSDFMASPASMLVPAAMAVSDVAQTSYATTDTALPSQPMETSPTPTLSMPTSLTTTGTIETELRPVNAAAPAANLELQIDNVRPHRGKIKVAIFADPENFLNPSFALQTFDLKDDATIASTKLAIDKPCAIAVFQDLDGDGQLSKNRLGIPVEPCGFSNNATIKRGPPTFSQAMVAPSPSGAPTTRVNILLP